MPKSQINLLPREEFEKKPLGKFLIWALSVGRWIVIFTELIVIIAFLSRFKLDRDISDLHDKIKQKQARVQSSQEFERDFRFFQKRISEIKNLETKQIWVTSIISEVSQITPVDVAFSNFSFGEEGINLTGTALSEEGLGSFLAGLASSPMFGDINLSSVSKKTEEAGIRFTITAKVQTGGKENAL
ncbi:MAG: PilN domain-containing protein [Patescibacteria group bacterium]